ncbi:hypothetical protein L3Y34_004382 [Caenorhabditis briggsae]|uniref:ZZ-type domain-containing protein n=1 Tax=Caenorhabditis briggsae TaxID=6238 RepID=A0AAE9A8W2_CAEBR|nr:hypothetical protein L3Y34_004382 [Caenorhabditis briggsae]
MAAQSSSAPHQMQVRVTFYTSHNPQSVLMILNNEQALEQITEKAQELFSSADYRLFYGKIPSSFCVPTNQIFSGDVNGPIYEFTDSEQVMSKIRITTFSRTPQLFVRLESGSSVPSSSNKKTSTSKESKSGASLKRIEQNQELTLKKVEQLQKDLDRVGVLETMLAELKTKESKTVPEVEKEVRPFPPSKHSASCDACLGDIVGHRYKCLECADYDLCEKCERKSVHYEHAMVRIVSPSMTKIPSYVTNNSPNNVFPRYMQSRQISDFERQILEQLSRRSRIAKKQGTPVSPPAAESVPTPVSAPAAAPVAAPEPTSVSAPPSAPVTGPEARIFNDETCAAIINSAAILKDTFSTLSKSFMDLADGAQANMGTKIVDRSTMEAGVRKVEEKVDSLKRHCEEKCFGIPAPTTETFEEVPRKSAESAPGPKIKKAKKKSVYKKSSEKLVAMTLAAAAEEQYKAREEAKKRADASTAELQRKLAELNMKPATEPVSQTPIQESSNGGSLDALMRAILSPPTVDPTTTPNVEPATPQAPTPVPYEPIYPTVETLIVPPLPVAEPKLEGFIPPQTSVPISIHSSFENISSDMESLSPSWGQYEENADAAEPETMEENLLDFENIVLAQGPSTSDPSLGQPLDAATEKTFDRLLEMGFDYNVVVAAIKANGSDLEKCLIYLIN